MNNVLGLDKINKDWYNTKDELPQIKDESRLASNPLFFIVDGNIFAGHYHSNGWFYNEVDRLELHMAKGSTTLTPVKNLHNYSQVTHWKYMR